MRAVRIKRVMSRNFAFRARIKAGSCGMDGTVEDIARDTFPSLRARDWAGAWLCRSKKGEMFVRRGKKISNSAKGSSRPERKNRPLESSDSSLRRVQRQGKS